MTKAREEKKKQQPQFQIETLQYAVLYFVLYVTTIPKICIANKGHVLSPHDKLAQEEMRPGANTTSLISQSKVPTTALACNTVQPRCNEVCKIRNLLRYIEILLH